MTRKKKKERPYTEYETAFIKQYYTQYTDEQLAALLSRDTESIAGKMAEIGLKRSEKMVEKLQGKAPENIKETEVMATEVDPKTGKDTEV